MTDKMPVEIGLRLTSHFLRIPVVGEKLESIKIELVSRILHDGTFNLLTHSSCIPADDTSPKPHGKHLHHLLRFNNKISVIPFREVPILKFEA